MTTPRYVKWGLALMVLMIAFFALTPSPKSDERQLRAYEARLRGQGEKLTLAELHPGLPTQNVRVIVVLTNSITELRKTGVATSTVDFSRDLVATNFLPTWDRRPATLSWDQVEAGLQVGQKALEALLVELRQGAQPWVTCTNVLTGPAFRFVDLRDAAQWLALGIASDVRRNRHDAAVDKIRCLVHLANSNQEDNTLVSGMLRVAIARLGLEVTGNVIQRPGWTTAQRDELAQTWNQLKPLEILERSWVGERALLMNVWEGVRRRDRATLTALELISPQNSPRKWLARCFGIPFYRATSIDKDQLFYLRCVQETLDRVRQVAARKGVDLTTWRGNQLVNRLRNMGPLDSWQYTGSAAFTPNGVGTLESAVHMESERQLLLARLALANWIEKTGEAPERLEQATHPMGLDLYDPYTGGNLVYQKHDCGWSVTTAKLKQ